MAERISRSDRLKNKKFEDGIQHNLNEFFMGLALEKLNGKKAKTTEKNSGKGDKAKLTGNTS